MWRPPVSVCPATKQLVGFSRISVQHLLTQVLSHHEFREKRIRGIDTLLMGGNEFISVLSFFLTDLVEIRYNKLQI
jgi:hypothetical protein